MSKNALAITAVLAMSFLAGPDMARGSDKGEATFTECELGGIEAEGSLEFKSRRIDAKVKLEGDSPDIAALLLNGDPVCTFGIAFSQGENIIYRLIATSTIFRWRAKGQAAEIGECEGRVPRIKTDDDLAMEFSGGELLSPVECPFQVIALD